MTIRRLWLYLLAALLFAHPAFSVNDPVAPFPGVLADEACTDSFNSGGLDGGAVGTIAHPQTTGSGDGLCDGGTKILLGTFAASTDFGVMGSKEFQNGILRFDVSGVVGSPATWRICIKTFEPWSQNTWSLKVECSETITGTGTGDDYIGLGPIFGHSQFDLAGPLRQPLPPQFKVHLELLDATGWLGSIGFIPVYGAGGRPARLIDDLSGAAVGVTFAHHELHEEDSFHSEYSVTTASSDDDVTGILFKTPNTAKLSHMVVTVSSSHPAEAIINEGPTLADSGDGSDLAVFNRVRDSANESTLESLEDTPTVGSLTSMDETEWTAIGVSSGTELEHMFLAGGSGPFAVGGVSRGTQEWIWKPDTVYTIYLQNTGANANTHYVGLDWYEHVGLTE